MFIEYIHLKNYRQYKDAKFSFGSKEEGKHIVIIEGGNGSGKTNLMNAVTWCLFSEERHIKKGKEGLPRVNLDMLHAAKTKSIVEVSVELCIRDDEKKPIYITRTQLFQKKAKGKPEIIPSVSEYGKFESSLMVQYQEEKDIVTDMNPSRYIEQLIPHKLSDYFFFDGEKLHDYFETESTDRIKEAVLKLSQSELLIEVITHLRKTKKNLRDKHKVPTGELQQLRTRVANQEKQVGETKNAIEELRKEKKRADSELEEISAKIALTNVESVKRLHKERQSVESFIEQLSTTRDGLEQDISELVIEWGPIAVLMDPIETARRFVAEAESAGQLPPPYKKNLLDSLLKNEECLCERKLKPGTSPYDSVKVKRDSCDSMTDDSEEISRLDAELRGVSDRFPREYKRLVLLKRRLKESKDSLEKQNKKLEDLNTLLGEVDIEKVQVLEKARGEAKLLVDNLIEQRVLILARLQRYEDDLKELKKQYNLALRKNEKFHQMADRLDLLERSEKYAERIIEDILREIREEVRSETRDHFFSLVWKSSSFKDVHLSDDYEVSVSMGSSIYSNVVGSLSAGETQVLALSFMAALNTVAKAGVPIMIDTPLSRISKEPRALIAEKLPSYLKGNQLILLMTDTEYTDDVRDRMSKAVGTELRIEYREISEDESESWVVDYA